MAHGRSELSINDLILHQKRDVDMVSIRSEIDCGEDDIAKESLQTEERSVMPKKESQNKEVSSKKKLRPFQSKPRNYKQNSRY